MPDPLLEDITPVGPEVTNPTLVSVKSQAMLSPAHAWRVLCRRTGGGVSRATFYRWVSNGKVYSVRLGFRIYIPLTALENLIKQCMAGERF